MLMKNYIVITPKGYTEPPKLDCKVENLQVLGIVENVKDKNEAINKLLNENTWVLEFGFNPALFIAYEIIPTTKE